VKEGKKRNRTQKNKHAQDDEHYQKNDRQSDRQKEKKKCKKGQRSKAVVETFYCPMDSAAALRARRLRARARRTLVTTAARTYIGPVLMAQLSVWHGTPVQCCGHYLPGINMSLLLLSSKLLVESLKRLPIAHAE
jgi:hypothetical protein